MSTLQLKNNPVLNDLQAKNAAQGVTVQPYKQAFKNPDPENLFVVRDHSGVAALKYWLQKRKYNTFIHSLDKNGKPLFGLLWDYHIGQFPSPSRRPRGAIIMLDRTFEKQVALVICGHAATETEFGKQWVQAQRALWMYGRS